MKENNERNNTDKGLLGDEPRDQYRLNTENGRAKRAFRNILIGIASLALSAVIAIASYNGDGKGIVGALLSVQLVLLALGFFVAEIIIRARYEKNAQLTMEKDDRVFFGDTEVVPVFSTERMLRSDTVITQPQRVERVAVNAPSVAPSVSAPAFHEAAIGFSDAVAGFVAFAQGHGCRIEPKDAKALFASLASSRIIVLRQTPTEELALLVDAMSAYFGTKTGIDRVDNSYTDAHSCLFETVAGERRKRAAMQTLEAAQAAPDKLHFVTLADVRVSNVANYLAPFIQYANTPDTPHLISVNNDGATEAYGLPSNLWVILNLAQGERVASLPEALLECCSVGNVSVSVCEKTELSAGVRSVSRTQLDRMIDGATCNVAESEWKKLDRLTDFVNQQVPFAISNKQWIGMETYVAVLNECGEPISSALDEAIAARIVPPILAKTVRTDGRINATAGLNVSFGDGQLPISRRAIKELSGCAVHV